MTHTTLTQKEQARYRAIMRQIAGMKKRGWTPEDHPDFEILQDELNALATKMTTKPVKHQAQDAILHAAMNVFYHLTDEDASPELVEEAHRQINRIEKLFGYEPGTWRS